VINADSYTLVQRPEAQRDEMHRYVMIYETMVHASSVMTVDSAMTYLVPQQHPQQHQRRPLAYVTDGRRVASANSVMIASSHTLRVMRLQVPRCAVL